MMAAPAAAAGKKGKEKCYGITKAGENACHAADGSHSCAGQAKVDKGGQDWKLVEAGTCVQMGGKTEAFTDAKAPTKGDDAKKGG
jgi:uncharacterized membrane protein